MVIDDSHLTKIFDEIVLSHGTPMFVGGFVRDKVMGLTPKDIDIEVYNLTYDELNEVLKKFGDTDLVGKSFGIIKLGPYDFSLPRRDSKTGPTHKSFNIHIDEMMSIEQACSRRDFTINSMAMTVFGEIIDYFGGQNDISSKILRPTSSAFWEDSLRLLRGFQFAARFGFSSSYKLKGPLDIQIVGELNELPKSRIYEEFKKWALKGTHFIESLQYLIDTMNNYFPNIHSIHMLPQDPEWHPEGDVLVHTGHVLNHMALIIRRENLSEDDSFDLMMAALCHDFGKATTTEIINGRYRAYGHEKAGVDLSIDFLQFIGAPNHTLKKVPVLVGNHMAFRQHLSDKAIRKLASRLSPVSTIRELAYLIEADQCGRPPLPKIISESLQEGLKSASKLNVLDGRQAPLVSGQDLMEIGFKQSKKMGEILKWAYQKQLDGIFNNKEQAMEEIRNEWCNTKNVSVQT